MAYNLGSAYIQVVPTTKGFGKSLEGELAGTGERASKKMGGKLWSGLKAGAVGAGVAIGGVLAGSVVKGFKRLTDIENAEAALSGLGHSASDVEKIMGDALASVKGTAFGMGDAASAAASAVAAGVKPGKDLQRYLGLAGDAAAIAGIEFTDMASIFNKVQTSGKVQGDVFAQLGDAGIPVVQLLADEMGVAAEEVYKLGSDGKISSDVFLEAMSSMEGSALKLGNTTEGAWKNMGASMGRFGATLLKEVFPYVAPLLGKITELFDYLSDRAGPAIESVMGKLKPFAAGIKGVFDILTKGEFTGASNLFGFEEDSAFVGFLFGVRDAAKELWDSALKPLGTWIADNWKPIATVLGGIAAFFVGGAIVSAIGAVGGAIAAFVAGISWVGVAIGAAIGGLTHFFTQTDKGRAMLDTFVSFVRDTLVPGIVEGFGLVKDFVVNELWPMIKSRFEAIRDLAVQVWQGVIQPAFEQFADYIMGTLWPILKRVFVDYIGPAIAFAWENIIKPAMAAMDDFIGNVLGPALVWLWENVVSPIFGLIGKFIGWVWNTLIFPYLDLMKFYFTEVLPTVFGFLWDVAKKVWSGISDAVGAAVEWITGTAVPWIQSAWDTISGGAQTLWGYIAAAWDGISGAISAVVGWVTGTAVPWLQSAWDAIKGGAEALWGYVVAAWDGIKAAVDAVVQWFQTWVAPVIELVAAASVVAFNKLRDAVSAAWAWIKDNAINPVVGWFQNTAWPVIQSVIDWIKSAFNTMRDALKAAWDFVKNNVINPVITWFRTVAWPAVQSVVEWIKNAFNTMRDSLKLAWEFVKNTINTVVAWIRDTARSIIEGAVDRIKTAFNTMRDAIKAAWNFVKDNVIAPVANWFRDTVAPLFGRATDDVGNAFSTLKDAVKKAWEGIKDAAKSPVRFVVDTVINDALIGNFNKLAEKLGTTKLPQVSLPSGFARGGVLPGWSRMSDGDDQLVPMRRGEGVLVSEGLRTPQDKAMFLAANAAGRRGVGFSKFMQGGFAGGGILDKVKDLSGDALDAVVSGADWIGSALADPKAAFSKIVDGLIGNVPGSGLLRDAAIAVPKKIAGDIATKLQGAFGGAGAGPVGPMPPGASRNLTYARQVASAYGLRMTSFRRPGARTAGNGSLSLHAQGRAMDFSNSSGPTPQMMAFFNAMHPLRPTELLYSPAGRRQWRRSGRQADTSGATKRGHYNHVHVGFNKGGIFDQGGMMQPGMTGINLTKKPEAVLDPKMTRAYQVHAEALAAGGGAGIQIGTVQGFTAEEVAGAIERERRKREALYAR